MLIGRALLFAFFAPIGLKRHYALGVARITAMVMLLLVRLMDTGLGCILVLCGTMFADPEVVRKPTPAPDRPGAG